MIGSSDIALDGAVAATDARARPAIAAVVLLASGYLVAREFAVGHSALWLGTSLASLILALLARGAACRVALSAAVFLGGVGWFTLRIHERPGDSLAFRIEHDPLAEPALARVSGMVMGTPRPSRSEADRWPLPAHPRQTTLDVRVRSFGEGTNEARASGVLRVRIDAPHDTVHESRLLHAGAWVRLTGVLRPIGPPQNPGEPDRTMRAAQEGVVGALFVPSIDLIARDRPADGWEAAGSAWARLVAGLRSRVERTLGGSDERMPEAGPGRPLLRAMLLGERDPALREVESAFRRVGLVHIMAISGFNLAVLAWVAMLAVRLTGDRGRLEPIIASATVALYMLILPGEASIRRAGCTALVFMASEALGRRYDRVTLLAWTAAALLVVSPLDLWSLGFQLSFGIVGALLVLGGRVHERLWGIRVRGLVPTPQQRRWWWIGGSMVVGAVQTQISATLLAWAVATPLIVLHTGLFSPLAPVASMVVLPLTILILVLGYAGILIGMIVPDSAGVITAGLGMLGDLAVWIVMRIDEWPLAMVRVPRVSVAWTVLATVCTIYWLGWAWVRDARGWLLAAITAAWLAVLWGLGSHLPPETSLRIDALAVGDGSCTLVRSGRDAVLIDAGASTSRPDGEDLSRIIRELGAFRVAAVLITEPRVEAWSLLPGTVDWLGIRAVLLAKPIVDAAGTDASGAQARLLRLLAERRVNVRIVEPGDRFAVGGAVVSLIDTHGDAASPGLVPRVEVQTQAGPRSVLLASATRYARLEALPTSERHADVVLLPRVARASDRPAETVRLLGARVLIHSGGPAGARELLKRLGPLEQRLMLTARGAAWSEIRTDGTVRSGP